MSIRDLFEDSVTNSYHIALVQDGAVSYQSEKTEKYDTD